MVGMVGANVRVETSRCVNDSGCEPPGPLTQQLLDYWIRHPDAQGTVENIGEWWLLEQRIMRAVEDVRSVLTELAARGFVIERQQADGRVAYVLNREKEAEIRAWLAAGGGELPPEHGGGCKS
jgi:hypothetical protein